MRRALLAAGAAVLALSSLPAFADAPPQAMALCTDAPRGCAIQVADRAREGATVSVTVQGRPQTRVRVVAYQALADGAVLRELVPLGDGVELLTSYAGIANVDLTIPSVVDHRSSGWALISVEGVTGTDVSLTVGTFVPFGARIPTVLGDGYGDAKPVGQALDLHVVGAIPGTRFAVELQGDDGGWSDVTVGDGYVQHAPDDTATISYALPRGLTSTPKKLRLRNVSDSATETVWLAVPSSDGEQAPRKARFVPPPVGDALDGTATLDGHPTEAVQHVATAIAVGSVSFVGVSLAGDALRRRRAGGVVDG